MRASSRRAGVLVATAALLSAAVLALPEPRASAAVPTPESVLGFAPGEERRLADWGQVLAYLRALAAASDRVSLEELGRTTQGRPFVLATVTSAANHARLEAIRATSEKLADPRGLSEAEAERLVHEARGVVAMAFSIHSTEVGGTLAALRLLHRLASAQDAETRAWLDEVVLLVIPSHNPDGTDLVADWYRRQLGTPFEGTAPPVLYHPYAGHDNNRDWYMFTQQETRLTVDGVYRRWHPQVVHDVHQMGVRGARLFLPPYTDPWEPNVDGALVAASNALGAHVASRLASEGRTGIVTGALFDAWTPGRAYPHTHGGVRVLSETASARLATPVDVASGELEPAEGLDLRTPSARLPRPWPGGHWTLGDVVETQLRASLAIVEHVARHREHWLRTALEANRRACARSEPYAFVLPAAQRDRLAAARLVSVLQRGEVEVERAPSAFDAGGRRYEAGALVVRLRQPASGFAKTLLERQRYPDLRTAEGEKPRRPYDVTAHTLPLLLGVEVDTLAAPFTASLERVGRGVAADADTLSIAPGRVAGDGPRLAFDHTSGGLLALARLLEAGVRVRWALEPFTDGGRTYAAGTLLAPASARPRLEPLARELGLDVTAVRASPPALRLAPPRVGLYRSWVPALDEGWTRFFLEREAALPYRTLHDRELRAGRLRERFDAIVLPDQPAHVIRDGHAAGTMPPEYTGGLGDPGAAALRAFVEEGGTLVALNDAARYAIAALALPVRDVVDGVPPASFFCPGSILQASVLAGSPLGHGLPSPLPVWFELSPAFEVQRGATIVGYDAKEPLLSGWLVGRRTARRPRGARGGTARQGTRRALRLPAAVPRARAASPTRRY